MSVPLKAGILLADDHPVVRGGLRLILDAEPDLEVAAEASDGAEALERAAGADIDLALLDVAMPRLTGIQVAGELTRRRPKLRVLILSMHEDEQYVLEAARVGAAGYVSKSVVDRDLVAACRAAISGAPFVWSPQFSEGLADRLESVSRGDWPEDLLTPRESEILKLVAEGRSTREIAETLVISAKTVEKHRTNLLDKLDMRNGADLTRYAIRRGLVQP